jgi:hypothetical protein
MNSEKRFPKNSVVVCIDHDNVSLTIGKKYTVMNEECYQSVGIEMINDDGNRNFYNSDRFATIVEYRSKKIAEIINRFD